MDSGGKKYAYLVLCLTFFIFVTAFATIHASDSSEGASTISVSNEAGLISAVSSAHSGDTIVVTADITLYHMLYVYDKDITIEGNGTDITISRGVNFTPAFDAARQDYNPAMFEVANTSSLTLIDITLDDANNPDHASEPLQEPVSGGSPVADWAQRVYDAVIATYSSTATITLGSGAKIVNVGGASAIRMAGGKLNLELGSYVEGSNSSYRYTSSGIYGAIWIQGDGAILNFDAIVDGANIIAPYIYSDMYSSTVNFNGKIINCTVSQPLIKTNYNQGFTLNTSAHSEMNDNTFSSGVNYVAIVGGNQNVIELRGTINNNVGGGSSALYLANAVGLDLSMYGEISGNALSNQAISVQGGQDCTATLEPSGKISYNGVSISAIYLNYATNMQFHIYGEISYNISYGNNGGAMYVIYNNPVVYVHAGAKIIGNTAYGSGGGIYLNYSATLIMDGGTISGNTAQCIDDGNTGLPGGGGVAVARDAKFIMNGGTITDNTAGIAGYPGIGGGVFVSGKNTGVTNGGRFTMNGGTVTGNHLYSGANGIDLAVGGSSTDLMQSSPDKGQYIQIGKNAVIGSGSIGASRYDTPMSYDGSAVYLLDRSYTLSIGTVLVSNQTLIANEAKALPAYSGYSLQPNYGVWYSITKTTGTSSLIITYPPGIDPNDSEWIAAIQPMGSDGSFVGNVEVVIPARAANGFEVTVPLTADAAVKGYGIVLLSETKNTDMTLDVVSSGSGSFYIDSPSGPEYQAVLSVGDTVNDFVISPLSGWKIKSVILTSGDGSVFNKTNDAISGTLTVSYNELASGTNIIKAVFEPITPPMYYITATADGGSTITPSGVVSVAPGNSMTFTFSANQGFDITNVYVDSTAISPAALASGQYTFSNVIADHMISVVSTAHTREVITLTIDVSPQNGGYAEYSLNGGQTFTRYTEAVTVPGSSSVVVRADANSGYSFDRWDDGSTIYHSSEVPLGALKSSVHLDLYFTGGSGSGKGGWAVLNLICAVLAIFTGLIAVAAGKDRFRKDDVEKRSKTAMILRLLALIIGIISVIVFFLTEDLTIAMITDKWTLLMFILLLVTLVLTFVSFRFDKDSEGEDAEEIRDRNG